MQKARKLYIAVVLVFFVFFLFRNEQNAAIETKDYIMTLGFDYKDGKRVVFYETPKLKKDAADQILNNKQTIKNTEVNRYQEFVENYMQVSDKEADFHHLKVMIIGKNLIKNSDEFTLFLEFLNEQEIIAENVLLFVDGSDKGIFDEERDGSIGSYLENSTDYEMKEQKNQIISAAKLLASFYNENQTLYMPVVDENMSIKGYGVVSCGKWEAFIDSDEGHLIFLGNGWKTKEEYYLEDLMGEGAAISETNNFSVVIDRMSREFTFEERENIIHVNCVLSIEGTGKDSNGKEIQDYRIRQSYGAECEELLQLSLQQQIEKLQKIDVLNTFYELSNKNRDLWKKYRHQYEQYKQNMTVHLDVKVKLKE